MFLFDAQLCCPNGDVESGGPRILPNGKCLVTKQCINYKLKRYWDTCGISVLHYCPNGELIVDKLGGVKPAREQAQYLSRALEFIDIRLFGACDLAKPLLLKVTGAVTFEHAKSVDKVNEIYLALNRSYKIAVNDEGENVGSGYANLSNIIEYGLFTSYGGTNYNVAKENGLSDQDMELFFEGLGHIFDDDAANVRPVGSMNMRKLIIWSWEGNKQPISDIKLKNSVLIKLKEGVNFATDYNDYIVTIATDIEGIETKIIEY